MSHHASIADVFYAFESTGDNSKGPLRLRKIDFATGTVSTLWTLRMRISLPVAQFSVYVFSSILLCFFRCALSFADWLFFVLRSKNTERGSLAGSRSGLCPQLIAPRFVFSDLSAHFSHFSLSLLLVLVVSLLLSSFSYPLLSLFLSPSLKYLCLSGFSPVARSPHSFVTQQDEFCFRFSFVLTTELRVC